MFGTIANMPDTLRSPRRKLSKDGPLCYEAGPCGYVQRQLTRLGTAATWWRRRCPRASSRQGEDRPRDAMMLAQTLAPGS